MTSSELPDEGERTRLTRAAVVDRALALADRDGPEALTIRKLATELGVTPMALYWHFRSKDELLLGITDRIWSEIDIAVDQSAPWTEQIRSMFISLLLVLRAHPAACQLMLPGSKLPRLHSEEEMNVAEAALEVLRGAGFSPEDASAATRAALYTGVTLVMAEPGSEFPDPGERGEKLRKYQVELATLPPGRYPRLVESALPMTTVKDPEEYYKFGVDLFIGGLAAIAAARAEPALPSETTSRSV